MHTVSSASSTCLVLKSAVECTATVLIPSSRQARRIRSAISPRLAMTTFSSMATLFDYEQRLAELNRVSVARHDGGDAARFVGLDLVHHLHGFDDAQDLSHFDLVADLDERFRTGRGCAVKGADHGCGDDVLVGFRLRDGHLGCGGRLWRHG